MFPSPADSSLRRFDKPLPSRHEACSRAFPLSPLNFDHELFNDITLLAPPPQMSSPSPPPHPPDHEPTSSSHTKPSPGSTAAFFDCGAAPAKEGDGDGGGVGRRLRKDRHSKIYTAQGPRDRRMRLSLEVARKFFDLQDALGFDKASKTVDWLLGSCRSSIMELTGRSSSPRRHRELDVAAGNGAKSDQCYSSTSECEVMSASTNHHAPAAAATAKRASAAGRARGALAAHGPPFSRESRQMARDRARERTKKKKMLIRRQFEEGGDVQRKQPAACSSPISPFETGKDSGAGTHTTKPSSDIAEEGRLGSSSPDQYKNGSAASPPAAIAGGSSSSAAPISVFDYDQNIVHNGEDISLVEEQYHWDIRTSGNNADQEQRVLFADAQLQPFLWEAYNPCIW